MKIATHALAGRATSRVQRLGDRPDRYIIVPEGTPRFPTYRVIDRKTGAIVERFSDIDAARAAASRLNLQDQPVKEGQ
jgi:hypothetical protein